MTDLIFPPCDNCSTFMQKLVYINSLSDVGYGGMAGIFFLIIFASVLFLIQKSFQYEKAAGVTLFITCIVGLLFAVIGLVSSKIIYVLIILFLISLFLLFQSNEGP
ncbi:MAG: hypothetical protein ACFFG0_07970 [Candidatus Thorarchaeota archaeon]